MEGEDASASSAGHAGRATIHFLDLDDACLLGIMRHLSPLPDLFSLASVCSRLRDLAHDARTSIIVGGAPPVDFAPSTSETGFHSATSHISGRWSPTLEDAVRRSLPGDTILLRPGVHAVTSTVVVSQPLRIRGVGPGTSVVCGARGVDPVLDVRSTALVEEIHVVARRGSCVRHRAGSLVVDRCCLRSMARSLEHLFPPLMTQAGPVAPKGSEAKRGGGPGRTSPCVGPGRVSVSETVVEGGTEAIVCAGRQGLSSVRAIYTEALGPLFWFTVAPAPAQAAAPGFALARGRKRGREEPVMASEGTTQAAASEWSGWVSSQSRSAPGGALPGGGTGDLARETCQFCIDMQRRATGQEAPGPSEGATITSLIVSDAGPSSGDCASGSWLPGAPSSSAGEPHASLADLIECEMRRAPYRGPCVLCGRPVGRAEACG